MNVLAIIIIGVLALVSLGIHLRYSKLIHKLNNRQAQLSQDLNLYKTGLKSLMGVFNSRGRMLEAVRTYFTEKNGELIKVAEFKKLQKQFISARNWQRFIEEYEKLEQPWLSELNSKYDLTINDKKILIMKHLQLSNADMLAVMNVSAEGLKKAKSRLRKKVKPEDIKQTTL